MTGKAVQECIKWFRSWIDTMDMSGSYDDYKYDDEGYEITIDERGIPIRTEQDLTAFLMRKEFHRHHIPKGLSDNMALLASTKDTKTVNYSTMISFVAYVLVNNYEFNDTMSLRVALSNEHKDKGLTVNVDITDFSELDLAQIVVIKRNIMSN